MLIEISAILLLLLINAALSMAEMAVVSSKKTRLSQWAQEGRRGAQSALRLASDPGKMLSTVQVGITVVGVLSGVFSGAEIATNLQEFLAVQIPLLADYSRIIGVGVMVTIVTFLNIVVGELLPKRIALQSPETIATFLSGPLNFASRVMRPIVSLLDNTTLMLLKFLGKKATAGDTPVTEEEIKTLVQQGTLAGVFHTSEQDMMERVLAFNDRNIHSMMTARPDIVFLDVTDDFEKNQHKITSAPHSHFPLVRGTLDAVLGTVHIKNIYAEQVDSSEKLAGILTSPLFIPETSGALHVLDVFRRTGMHIAFIIDEYGSVQGVVTLTDLLEAIVGNLPAFDEPNEAMIVMRKDNSYLVDGMIPIDEFKKHFKIAELPNEERAGFQTLAGFILSMMGCIPKTADSFEWKDFRFEVVDMDGNRIDKVLVDHTPKQGKVSVHDSETDSHGDAHAHSNAEAHSAVPTDSNSNANSNAQHGHAHGRSRT